MKTDYFFIALIFLLVIFGLVMLTSASSDLGQIRFGDSYFYLKHQLLHGIFFGLIAFVVFSKLYYQRLFKISFSLLLFSIFLLILPFTPIGFSFAGASRWISFGNFTIQPSEIIKFSYLIYLAAWLSKRTFSARGGVKSDIINDFLPFLFFSILIFFILLFQRSTSSAVIILLSGLIVYFVGQGRMKFILATAILSLIILSLVIYFTAYRLERITSFLRPGADPLGRDYHQKISLLAISQGGLFGVGYGQSITKIHYLPESIGDSIFSVIAEELGFVGAVFLIFLFLLLLWRSFLIAKKADKFAKLLVIGFSSLITIQAITHIGANSGLLPLTGLTLPFISFGGTSLVIFLAMAGVIANISKHTK